MRGELKDSQASLDCPFAEFKEAKRNLEDAGTRITEKKGKQMMPTNKSQLIGIDADERRRSSGRLRRISMTA